MVELRWAVSSGTTTEQPMLQYRVNRGWPAPWSEWHDVPREVVKACPATGNMCRSGCAERACWQKTRAAQVQTGIVTTAGVSGGQHQTKAPSTTDGGADGTC